MSKRLEAKELDLIKRAYLSGEDKLSTKDKEALTYAKAKPVTADDVMDLLNVKYPVPTDDEMAFVKEFVARAGMMKLTPEQNDLLNATADKRASLQDVIGIVMEAYRNELATRYRELAETQLNLQMIIRDELASASRIKQVAKRLNNEGELSDKALSIINKQNFRMSKRDYAEAKQTTEDALNKVVDKMNEMTDKLDKVAHS